MDLFQGSLGNRKQFCKLRLMDECHRASFHREYHHLLAPISIDGCQQEQLYQGSSIVLKCFI